jgi:hypothetical protein
MPTTPSTLVVAQAIQSILQDAKINNNPAYANVILGGLKNYVGALPVAVILASKGSSDRFTLGRSARIHDELIFEISSVVDYTNAATAETSIMALRDTATFLFAQSATLGNPSALLGVPGVIIVNMVKNSERYGFPQINGQVRRSHSFLLEVTYEYTLPNGPQP